MIVTQRGINRRTVVSHKFYEPGTFGNFRPDTTIWVRRITDSQEIRELLPPRVRSNHDDLLQKVNGVYLAMSVISNMRKFFFSTPPRFISVNGTPSDHLLPNPVVNTLYANYVFCIIDVDSTLNYGKLQTTNRRLIHECGQLYLDIYRHAVIKIGEKVIGTHIEADTSSRGVQGTTNIIGLPDLGIASSLKKEPADENALIALFFDLLGRGVIRDYEFYSLHAKRKYDATAMMKTASMQAIPRPTNDNDLKNIEFKLLVSDLIEELEDGKKTLAELTLIVVWEDDITGNPNAPSQYEVIPIEDSSDRDSSFNRVNKCLFYRGTGIERQMIVVKDLVQALRTRGH
jgi:hypothetical protein